MWWARVVNALFGSSLASVAIRRSFVETLREQDCDFLPTVPGLGLPAIFLSDGPMTRRKPFLHGVARGSFPRFSGSIQAL